MTHPDIRELSDTNDHVNNFEIKPGPVNLRNKARKNQAKRAIGT
jgi:hypothetical protein